MNKQRYLLNYLNFLKNLRREIVAIPELLIKVKEINCKKKTFNIELGEVVSRAKDILDFLGRRYRTDFWGYSRDNYDFYLLQLGFLQVIKYNLNPATFPKDEGVYRRNLTKIIKIAKTLAKDLEDDIKYKTRTLNT